MAKEYYIQIFGNVQQCRTEAEIYLAQDPPGGPLATVYESEEGWCIDYYLDPVNKEDEKLISLLSKFNEVIEQAAVNYKPHLLSRYLLDLAQAFNEFYHASPILQADEEVRDARLNLILAVKQVLEKGLNLLGIEAPEAM